MEAADVEALRVAGFSDVGILDIVQVVGYYAYVNRLADGLGVELDEYYHMIDDVSSTSFAIPG